MTSRWFVFRAAAAVAVTASAVVAPVQAQEAGAAAAPAPAPSAAQAAPTINYRERPRYPVDPQRLRKRPVLDGTIAEGEWDPLYTVGDGPVKGTVYVNWDDDFVYVGAKTDQPAWLVFDLDANGDGWLHGADNLELAVAPAGQEGAPPLTARILDAAGSRDAPVWNDKVVDPRSIQLVVKPAGGGEVIEMAIPKGIANLRPRVNATLSCRADFAPAGPAPASTQPYEPHVLVDITLVDARTVAAPGIAPRLALDDAKVIPGEVLHATLTLMNQAEEQASVRSVTWQGDGAAADLVTLLREVNVPPVPGMKTLRRKYSAPLSESAVPGFYQMTVKAQLEDGRSVACTASFQVVEPFSVQLTTEPDSVTVVGPTQLKAGVDIYSAVPGYARGDVQLEVPAGWDVKGRAKKDFLATREDSTTRPGFLITLPSTTQAGDYVLTATVTWRGKTWKAHRTVHVVRAAEAPKTEAPK